MNIFRRHRERELARQSASVPAEVPSAGAGEGGAPPVHAALPGSQPGSEAPTGQAAIMLIKLTEDRRRLSEIQSVERKIAVKRDELLPEYAAWIEGLLAAADDLPEGQPQDVLTTIMMWRIDAGDFDGALDIAAVVLAKAIPLPSQFVRTPACAVAEQIADAIILDPVLAGSKRIIEAVEALTNSHDMPDEVRAKLFKAYAVIAEAELKEIDAHGEAPDGPAGHAAALIDHGLTRARRALELDQNAGVKGLIKSFESRQKKLPASSPATAGEGSAQPTEGAASEAPPSQPANDPPPA